MPPKKPLNLTQIDSHTPTRVIFPTNEMERKFYMGFLGCYLTLIFSIYNGVMGTLFGISGESAFALRDVVMIIFCLLTVYFLHKKKYIWTVYVLLYYIADKIIFWPDLGIIQAALAHLILVLLFIAGAIGYIQFIQHKKKLLNQ